MVTKKKKTIVKKKPVKKVVAKKPVKKPAKKSVKAAVKKAVKVVKKVLAKKPVKKIEPKKIAPNIPAHVLKIYEICDGMKATDIVVLDMNGITSFTDYVVIASSSNTRQVVAIADTISMEMKKAFQKYAIGVEGKTGGQWVLIDYGDVICHLFLEETREFYRLENLWNEAIPIKM